MPVLGTVVTVAGIVLLMAYLSVVFSKAWRGDQGRVWDPGGRREDHDQQVPKRR